MGLSVGSDLESQGFKQKKNGNFNSEASRRNTEAMELVLVPSSLLTATVTPAGRHGSCWPPWHMLATVTHADHWNTCCRGPCWPPWLLLAAVALAGSRGSCWPPWLMLAAVTHADHWSTCCCGSCWPPWLMLAAVALAGHRGSCWPWQHITAATEDREVLHHVR